MIRTCNKHLSSAVIIMGIFGEHDTALTVNIRHSREFRDV